MKRKLNQIFLILIFVLAYTILLVITFNLSQPKINDGYYLSQGIGRGDQYLSIWVNWRNRIDERVFIHPDINTVLRVYSQLNELETDKPKE